MPGTAVTPAARHIIATHATFMQSDVAMGLATRGADGRLELTVGCGCRVVAAARRVIILVRRQYSAPFLAALTSSRIIAVEFGRPSTHEAIQVKGDHADVVPATRADLALVKRYRADFGADMARIDVNAQVVDTYLGTDAEICAVRFTPTAAFINTPGPDAGAPSA